MLEIREDPRLLKHRASVVARITRRVRDISRSILLRPARAHGLLVVRQRCKSPPPRTNSACPQARPGYSPRGPPPAVHTGSPAFLYTGSVSAEASSGRLLSRQMSRAYSATVRSLEK